MKDSSICTFKIRWFIENCMEIRLPNGKTIVVDPILIRDESSAKSEMEKHFISGFSVDDIESCDYVLLTHVHGDHIGSLAELYEKFKPVIMVNGWSAFPLAKFLDLPLGSFIPMTDGEEYCFDGFKLKWLQGRHSPAAGARRPSESMMGTSPEEMNLGQMGTIYNSNFVLYLDNGMTLVMDGGRYEPNLLDLAAYRPNLVFSHCVKFPDICAANFSDAVIRSGAEYLIPLCAQNQVEGAEKTVEMANDLLVQAGHYGRVLCMQPGHWVKFNMTCEME